LSPLKGPQERQDSTLMWKPSVKMLCKLCPK